MNNKLFSLFIGLIFAGVFCAGVYVFADPPGSPYVPPAPANPGCGPTDPNCTVSPPLTTGFTAVFSGTGELDTTGILQAGTLKVGSAYTFPTADGADGKVLTTDGAGHVTWQTAGSGTGGDTFWARDVDIFGNSGAGGLKSSPTSILDLPNSATGTDSIAMGAGATASGYGSTAMDGSTASGSGSTAMSGGTASGSSSVAMGGSTASGSGSVAMGLSTTASGPYGVAMGHSTTASGIYSVAMGVSSSAGGFGNVAMGNSIVDDTGINPTVCSVTTCAYDSASMGVGTIADGNAQLVIGRNNIKDAVGSAGVYSFIIGNGNPLASPRTYSNALTVDWSGNVVAAGSGTFASLKVPGTGVTYTLPAAYPAGSGYVLSSTTNGTLSWAVPVTGSGAQTPWASDITTAGFGLTDNLGTSNITIGGAGAFGSLKVKQNGGTAGKYTIFQGGAQSNDLTYILPTGYPAGSGYVLSSTASGTMSWVEQNASSSQTPWAGDITTAGFNLTDDSVGQTSNINVGGSVTGSSGSFGTVSATSTGTFGSLKIPEIGGTAGKYTTFQGGAQNNNITYTLPTAPPAISGYVLSSTTGGALSWVAPTGGTGSGSQTPWEGDEDASGHNLVNIGDNLGNPGLSFKHDIIINGNADPGFFDTYNVVVGPGASASGSFDLALGNGARAVYDGGLALLGTSSGYYSTAIGYSSNVSWGSYATAIGYNANVSGMDSIAIGNGAAIGSSGLGSPESSIAIGTGAKVDVDSLSGVGTGSIALGDGSTVTGSYSTAIGPFINIAHNDEIIFATDDGTYNNITKTQLDIYGNVADFKANAVKSPELITGAATIVGGAPTNAATSGSILIDPNGGKLWVANTLGWEYASLQNSFLIPPREQKDPISGDQMKVGDIVVGMIDKTNSENDLHGVWTKLDSVKQQTTSIQRMQMVDQVTGDIYCTWIANGDWQKAKGNCDSIAPAVPAPPAQPAPPSGGGGGGGVQPPPAPPAPDIVSVASISDINVTSGTALDSLNLPASVTVTMSDNSTQSLPVSWDQGTPTYDPNTGGTYVFSGTLVFSSANTNTNNIKASVNVTVVPAIAPSQNMRIFQRFGSSLLNSIRQTFGNLLKIK